MSVLLDRLRKEDPESLKRALGRPLCEAGKIAKCFGVSRKTVLLYGVDTINRCADDSARRLLLGCSIKNGPGD